MAINAKNSNKAFIHSFTPSFIHLMSRSFTVFDFLMSSLHMQCVYLIYASLTVSLACLPNCLYFLNKKPLEHSNLIVRNGKQWILKVMAVKCFKRKYCSLPQDVLLLLATFLPSLFFARKNHFFFCKFFTFSTFRLAQIVYIRQLP